MRPPAHWDAEADVVVIGSGAAGLMAALSAAALGQSVIVLEKSDKIGGTTAFSGALLWVPMNPKGAEVGLHDDRLAAIDYICATMGGPPDRTLVEAFVDSAAETVDFLERHSAVRLINTPYPDSFVEAPGGVAAGRHLEPDFFALRSLGRWRRHVRPAVTPGLFTFRELLGQGFIAKLKQITRANLPTILWRLVTGRRSGGNALVAGMLKGCLDCGVDVRLRTAATGLVQGDDGRVIGIECGAVRIGARRAVVLASGGFEYNRELVAAHLPLPLEHLPTPPGLAAGDNIALARQVGAELARMDVYWNWPAFQEPGARYEGKPIAMLMIGERTLPHSLWVNGRGERFCNEAEHNVAFALEARGEDGRPLNQPAWAIVDQQYRSKYPLLYKHMPGSKDPPWITKADSLGELAGRLGVDGARLAATVQRFNALARAGQDDDFGRGRHAYERTLGDRDAPHPNLGTVERPPFYAIPVHVSAVGTRGGARTDEHGRVLRPDGSVVAGLYGAGNAVAGFFGPRIMGGGATIMSGMTFARRAMRHAAGVNR